MKLYSSSMEHMTNNECYNEDDDALSLRDLQMYDQTATSSIPSSPRKSSFEFFPTLFPSEQHGEELSEAGLLVIPSSITEELNNRSSSLRLPERVIKNVTPLRSVSNRDFGSARHRVKLSKSKRMKFIMCGPVMAMPEMEMKSIKERQGRLAPSRMFPVTEKAVAVTVTVTNKNPVSCRARLNSMFERSFACLPI